MTELIPYGYQEEAITFATTRTGSVIADECGLGKTLVAVEAAKRLRKFKPWRCLVLCPPSLVAQWVKFISEQDDGGPLIYAPSRLPLDYKLYAGWFVNDYYALYNDAARERMQKVLWDLIILDEAHRIKNRQAKISKYCKQLNKVRSICLTATPMEAGAVDLWSILNFIDRPAYPAFHRWVHKHLKVTDNYWGGKKYGDPLDETAFGQQVAPYILRRTKKEVVPELPARIDIPQRVDMLPDQLAAYTDIKNSDDILVDVEDQTLLIQNVLTLITRLQQVSTDPSLIGLKAESGKLLWLKEFFDDHPNERVVVFTRFRNTALNLSHIYGAAHIVGGSISQDFHEDTFDRVFGTIDAMGEGLNLQRASTAIFLEGHWSTTKMTQALDRIHRVNILEPKNVYLLNSCREDIIVYKAITKKWSKQELVYQYLHG
jgi:SNF2 family DNA or RNA helicase